MTITPIVDVLYEALKQSVKDGIGKVIPNAKSYEMYLKGLSSGKKPTRMMIRSIDKERALNNSLYSEFRRPLRLAKVILSQNDLNNSKGDNTLSMGSKLVDVSFLWELYLVHLMREKLGGEWEIDTQSEIKMYENTFFSKSNYPDFVLENKSSGDIYVPDAKFKTMNFEKLDVDNHDLQQLHSYSCYFRIKYGGRFKGAGLLYPTKKKDSEKNPTISPLFGLSEEKAEAMRFGVFALEDIKIGENNEALYENENKFIARLKGFLEGGK